MQTQNLPNNIGVLSLKNSSLNLDRSHYNDNLIETQDSEERVKLLLVRDLFRLNWNIEKSKDKLIVSPPIYYDKEIIKQSMNISRQEILNKNREWIEKHIDIGRKNLTTGFNALKSEIKPIVEVCNSQKQNDLFRLYRYYWSSPASEYVGRRIRIIVRDGGLPEKPVIGIAAIGSSIIHIPDRDKWIGWDIKTRTKRIIYVMDAYVIGALPPYNDLLGGKLIAYILASNELRNIFHKKYAKSKTIISGRKRISDLALIMTTSLYGLNSSQYNRLKYKNSLLCKPIGITSGFGTLHISNETFTAMRELIESKGYKISHLFGMGPNWRMRVIRTACDILNLNSDIILKHSFKRGIYAIPLTINWKSFLNGKTRKPIYRNLPLRSLTKYWQERWLAMRKSNNEIVRRVVQFTPGQFTI